MKGRKPKPTAQKRLEGNPGKRPLNDAEPQFAAADTAAPDFLDDTGKAEWARLVPMLIANRMLTEGDRTALAAYCNAYSRWRKAEAIVAQSASMVFKTPTGYVQQIPHIGIANRYLDTMIKLAAEFGFTPAARSRLHIGDPKAGTGDAHDKFFGYAGEESKGPGARPLH